MAKSILELGSGKIDVSTLTSFKNEDKDFKVYVDSSYCSNADFNNSILAIENAHLQWKEGISNSPTEMVFSGDIFKFLNSYKFKFDHIQAHRIFEHQFYDDGSIGRLFDACNQITTDSATMEIVVPNFNLLLTMYYDLVNNKDSLSKSEFQSNILILNTELCNTRCDPHGSIWSPILAKHYIGSEGNTWKIDSIEDSVEKCGRNIYMKINLSK